MASVAMLIRRALANALTFTGSNYLFHRLSADNIDAEKKRHDAAIEALQAAQLEWAHNCVISCVTLKIDKIYYQSNHLWKGKKAVKKLAEYSKEKPEVIKQWLSRQAFWQVHLPAPKRVYRPHYQVTTPNKMHQFDLLYMLLDTLYGNK